MTLGEFWEDWIAKHPEEEDLAHFNLVAAAYEAGMMNAFEASSRAAKEVFSK